MATSGVDLSQVQGAATSGVLADVGKFNQQIEQLYGVTQANNAMSMHMAQQQQDWSAEQAELTRQFNAAEAAKTRKWQEMMSNTAHQREVKDLIAAGLNPVLSATGGNGAAVTSGATAAGSNPSGAAASPDMSMSNAFVSLLGNMLSVTTRLAEMSTSALTNQSVADKYTEAQKIAAGIAAAASRYGSDQHYAAAQYSADITKYIADHYQSNPWQMISGLINDLAEGGGLSGKSSTGFGKVIEALAGKAHKAIKDGEPDVIAGADRKN